MKPPLYLPPYDSPLENDFAYQVVKYLDEVVDLQAQYHVKTICGLFVVDFVVTSSSGRRVGFECDGKEFHNTSRDEWRDAMILGSGELDAIYRLRGADIIFQLDNILFLLSRCEKELFSERGHRNLKSLVHPDVQSFEILSEETNFHLVLGVNDSNPISRIHLERRYREIPAGRRQFWQTAYQFAANIGGGSLDAVMEKYRRSAKQTNRS